MKLSFHIWNESCIDVFSQRKTSGDIRGYPDPPLWFMVTSAPLIPHIVIKMGGKKSIEPDSESFYSHRRIICKHHDSLDPLLSRYQRIAYDYVHC